MFSALESRGMPTAKNYIQCVRRPPGGRVRQPEVVDLRSPKWPDRGSQDLVAVSIAS
jgi:hypothetical protein